LIGMQVDTNGRGALDYGEFLAVSLHLQRMANDEHLRWAFLFFDKDGNGFIEPEELREALVDNGAADSMEEVVDDILQEVDTDKDGKISYEEFVAMMKTGTDWRKASRHYSRGRFNSLSMKRWRSPASDASQAQQLQKILSCGALIDGMGSDFSYKWLDNTIMGIFLSSDTRHCSATDYSKPILDWLENSSDEVAETMAKNGRLLLKCPVVQSNVQAMKEKRRVKLDEQTDYQNSTGMMDKAVNLAMKRIIDKRRIHYHREHDGNSKHDWWRQPWDESEVEGLHITMDDFEFPYEKEEMTSKYCSTEQVPDEWVFGNAFTKYIHGLAAHGVHYLHRPGPTLQDLGFMILPELGKERGYIIDTLFTFVFLTFVLTKRFYNVLIWRRFLRIITFYATQLPGPNYHCREGSPLARLPPPQNAAKVFLIN
ncbi:hypothetical protein ACJX0J_037234, partial [Zea mays]